MPVVYAGGGYYDTGRLKEGETYQVSATYFRSMKEGDKPETWKEKPDPDPVTFVYKAGMEPLVLKSKKS